MTRHERLATYLRNHKRITPIVAIAELNDYRLSETVRKLRYEHYELLPAGYEIKTYRKSADTGIEYGEYRLQKVAA